MLIQYKLAEAKKIVTELLTKGHTASVEEVYMEGKLIGVHIHHYEMCSQCVKEREVVNGKERKI